MGTAVIAMSSSRQGSRRLGCDTRTRTRGLNDVRSCATQKTQPNDSADVVGQTLSMHVTMIYCFTPPHRNSYLVQCGFNKLPGPFTPKHQDRSCMTDASSMRYAHITHREQCTCDAVPMLFAFKAYYGQCCFDTVRCSWHINCITNNAPSMHTRRMHLRCTVDAVSMHVGGIFWRVPGCDVEIPRNTYLIQAPYKLHPTYIQTTSKLHQNCIQTTPKLHPNCTRTATNCIRTTFKLH